MILSTACMSRKPAVVVAPMNFAGQAVSGEIVVAPIERRLPVDHGAAARVLREFPEASG